MLLLATACGAGDGGAGANDGASGGTGGTLEQGLAGAAFNQCGVAAPLPANTGQCQAVGAPTLADFDDYDGSSPAASYGFYVNAPPPSDAAVLGGILHVDDGSGTGDGAGVIATEMVPGEGDAGYALQISNTNATNWGGLLMFYFPYSGSTRTCLDASSYQGVEFSIKGTTPSGRFGVTLGMLDTIPVGDDGFCDNPTTDDCKDAADQWTLPADSETWLDVRVPWSSFTPGIGSTKSCIPVTGQNVARLVIQPFMNYPPPDYMFEAGAYAIAVDNVRFF